MPNKKLHILIIPSWYPEHDGHYMGSFFREQAIGIKKNGCNVGIIYPELKSLRNTLDIRLLPRLQYFEDNGLKTIKLKWSNWFIKSKSLQIFAFKYIGYYLFKKYVKHNGIPDLIHCQSIFNAGFLGEYIFDNQNIPFIVTEHNSGFYYHNQGFRRFYNGVKRVLNKSKKCFAVSNNYSKYLDSEIKINKRWDFHHNLVNDQFIDTQLKKIDENNFTFLCVSRLHKIKNIDLIIQSFKIFNNYYPNSKLKIIGIGSELKNLKNIVIQNNLNNNVFFLGEKSRNDIVKEFDSSNAFVYASSFETFGVIFVEAMSLGKPIVSLNCKSSKEIIPESCGIIVEKKTKEDFANAMIKLQKNYSFYDPLKIKQYCKSKFSEKKISLKMIDHYKRVLNQ